MINTWMLKFQMCFSKTGVPRHFCLISARAKAIMKYPDLVSSEEKQATETYCSKGTSDCFAIVNVFDVSK